jgi:transposase
MGSQVVLRTRQLWSGDEKRSISLRTAAPDVSVAQVARRYGPNANLIFKWVRDPRFALVAAQCAAQAPCFLPVDIVRDAAPDAGRLLVTSDQLEVELAGGLTG